MQIVFKVSVFVKIQCRLDFWGTTLISNGKILCCTDFGEKKATVESPATLRSSGERENRRLCAAAIAVLRVRPSFLFSFIFLFLILAPVLSECLQLCCIDLDPIFMTVTPESELYQSAALVHGNIPLIVVPRYEYLCVCVCLFIHLSIYIYKNMFILYTYRY